MATRWRNWSTIGTWYKVEGGNAFRFYARVNEAGEVWLFADYWRNGQVVRWNRLLPIENNELSYRLAYNTALVFDDDGLAELRERRSGEGWLFSEQQARVYRARKQAFMEAAGLAGDDLFLDGSWQAELLKIVEEVLDVNKDRPGGRQLIRPSS